MKFTEVPKVLILSNVAMSDQNSNGRTINNLFFGWDSQCLAQFCVNGKPDFKVCKNHYQVTDNDAVSSILSLKSKGGVINYVENSTPQHMNNVVKKNPIKLLVRELVWGTGFWYGKRLKQWIEKFKPDVIFIYMGNSAFLNRLAIKIQKKYNIPIIIYTCENYYFKEHNYVSKKKSLIFDIYQYIFRRSVNSLFKCTSSAIYNTSELKKKYDERFPGIDSRCIMTNSDIDFVDRAEKIKPEKIVYLGNLGVGRHYALIEIGNALQEIDNNLVLDVYGNIPNDEVKTALNECKGIRYCGVVPYKEVVEKIHHSTLLIHAESFDDYSTKDLKFAFSTKIADSISSGTPLFCYMPKDLVCTQFLIKHRCAFVAQNKNELISTLKQALYDVESRKKVVDKCIETRVLFDPKENDKLVREMIMMRMYLDEG